MRIHGARLKRGPIGVAVSSESGGRIDAPTRWRFATVEGWWGVHDNFHVLALGVHLLQVLAIGRHLRQEDSPIADLFC